MNTNVWMTIFTSTVACALLISACGDETACSTDSDCFAAETCVDGECRIVEGNNANSSNNSNSSNNATNNTNNANNTNSNSSNNTTNNTTNSSNNATNNTNNTNNTNSSNNATNNTNNTNNAPACVVDPFSSCDPFEPAGEENDTWTDSERPGSSGGCVGDRDTVIPREWTLAARKCHLELGDWYGQTIVPCRTKTLTAEVRLTPKTMCPADAMALEFKRGGATIDCTDNRISCSMDGIDHVIQWLVPPANSVESYYFGVTSPRNDVDFDYDLTFSVQ